MILIMSFDTNKISILLALLFLRLGFSYQPRKPIKPVTFNNVQRGIEAKDVNQMRKTFNFVLVSLLVVLMGCARSSPPQPLITSVPANTTAPPPVITPSANAITIAPANTATPPPVITPAPIPIIITSNTTITIGTINNTGLFLPGGMTADEAIAKAKQFVPPQAVLRSKIEAAIMAFGFPWWRVTFEGANVSRAELEEMGWREGGFVRFGIQDPSGTYQNIIVDILTTGSGQIFLTATSIPITADEAITRAKKFVPPQAILRSNMQSFLDVGPVLPMWRVTFEGANVSRSELENFGWREGTNVSFGVPDQQGIFHFIQINVEVKTGDVLHMEAGSYRF